MTTNTIRKTTLHGLTHAKVARRLAAIAREMKKSERKFSPLLAELHDHFKHSGTNLIHYLVLRNNEIREIQEYLHHIGLSSLTNSESHTLSQLQHVLGWLNAKSPSAKKTTPCNFQEASRLQLLHAEELLGAFPSQDRPHIMVTFSAELMQDRKLIEEMLREGMTVARINCAHDTLEDWAKMINALKKAIAKTGKSCKIYMDLAGPKIRIKSIRAVKKVESLELPVKEGKELIISHAGALESKKHKGKQKKDILLIEPKELLDMVKEGEHIFFDDGKFEARVTKVLPGHVTVKIVRISAKNHFLQPERGINLPDSEITIPTLTEEDKQNIPFICEHADMVGYSFVNSPADIELLREEIEKNARARKPSIILKIERLTAVQNLPSLLINGMKDEAMGVMIARGDLAVEIGFERLSEIQEEILWICEAAHVPVIWATQVLETLNKTGYATRSEITDAAMSSRAECVMLNKGKYIVKTIETLVDILTRQQGHVNKKRYIMRPLGIAKNFIED
ncbi:MAG: pyruvate kinase [Saprospiraceae bacterium]|nr:pyruvate kinase [Candidatus Opimibacter iunctus]